MAGTKAKISSKSWKNTHYVTVYTLAKQGMASTTIAKALGVDPHTFKDWRRKDEALRDALERGRDSAETNSAETFANYVYNQLPARLKRLWDEINRCAKEANGVERMEALLKESGESARQHLFLYALTARAFNISAACKAVNITTACFRKWCTNDPDFQMLMDEIHFHKKNFFEAALVKLVRKGDASATIFVNKTVNRDRGYNEKVDINVTHHKGDNGGLRLEDLDLSVECKREILLAIRKKKELDNPKPAAIEYKRVGNRAVPQEEPEPIPLDYEYQGSPPDQDEEDSSDDERTD